MSLAGILFLPVNFLLHKIEKLGFWHIFEIASFVASALTHKPLKDLLEGILTTLLVRYVVAKSRLFVELSKGICGLFEASLQAADVHLSAIYSLI